MKNWSHRAVVGTFLLALVPALSGCMVSAAEMQDNITKFRASTSGQYKSEAGAKLYIAPVRARMVTDEALYLERHDPNGTIVGRLLNVEVAEDGKTIVLRALVFTQEGQWRNLRENPELFTALLPKDVRPAGKCDIKPSKDRDSLTYSCGGSPVENFTRVTE
ncbi:MAG TPA: hypothetical protein VEW08_00835 [Steroidobacteraceae bacterium]|nr:hypothetical protein [Steroidobacteraceae bacterium]